MSQLLLTGKSYRLFIQAVHSPESRLVYANSLRLYMRFRNVDNCDILVEENPLLAQQSIIDYIIYLREELKIAATTINVRIAAIRKFYDCNDIELKWRKIKSYIGRSRTKRNSGKRDRPYTSMEILKMLEKADERERVIILLMASTGMRVGALPTLKIRNLERIEKYQIYKIIVYENEDEEYITFCTPECARAIDSYLEYRQRHGERPLKEDSPLIREEFDMYDEIRATKPKALHVQAFQKMVRNIGIKSGVMQKQVVLEYHNGPRRPVKETHGFRKYFQTTAIGNGMNPLYSEILMGHSSGGLALESYVKPSENDLLEGNDKMIGYAGIIDALTINEENRLKRKVQDMKIKMTEIQSLKDEIDIVKKKIGLF